jgi:hypothetical protein
MFSSLFFVGTWPSFQWLIWQRSPSRNSMGRLYHRKISCFCSDMSNYRSLWAWWYQNRSWEVVLFWQESRPRWNKCCTLAARAQAGPVLITSRCYGYTQFISLWHLLL